MFVDHQQISHAMAKQKIASPNEYKAEFKKEIVGKAPEDVSKSYPEHDFHKILSFLASKVIKLLIKIINWHRSSHNY